MQGGARRGLVGTEDADDALLAVRRASSQWREGGEEGRQQRRSDLSGLPEERCREVDHAAAAGARVGKGEVSHVEVGDGGRCNGRRGDGVSWPSKVREGRRTAAPATCASRCSAAATGVRGPAKHRHRCLRWLDLRENKREGCVGYRCGRLLVCRAGYG